MRAELGAKVVGWKLAAPPSADVISAPLFDIECLASGAVLANSALLRDGVECELALRIDRPLPLGGCTRDDVMAAVGAVMPAFELLCSRLPSKFASPREHIVADGMGQGAVVLGAPCGDWRTLELDKLRVTLWADDALVVDKRAAILLVTRCAPSPCSPTTWRGAVSPRGGDISCWPVRIPASIVRGPASGCVVFSKGSAKSRSTCARPCHIKEKNHAGR